MTGMSFNTVVFDIGGSHASASLVRDEKLELHGVSTCPLKADARKEELLDSLEQLARKVLGDNKVEGHELSGIGFAFPGPFDYERGVSHAEHKHPSLYNVSVRLEMAARFAIDPAQIVFINDAAGYLLGEIFGGAAREGHRVIGMTLGTGVGSAFAVDGKIVTTGVGVPPGGEIWNVPWKGGIFEDAISTRAIQGIYKSLTGQAAEVKEIAARTGSDPNAAETFRRFGRDYGEVLKNLCEGFHPDLVVIGGAIARSACLFLPHANETLGDIKVKIVISQLFDQAALVGAGAKWLQTVRA